MPQAAYIDPENRLSPSEDYNFLRAAGIKLIEKLSGKIWTNYNTHDPGITLLEALCYSITDLAYRTSFDIKDLLESGAEPGFNNKDFLYTAREILPSGPVTLTDYRKVILDTAGVRNAWIETCSNAEVTLYFPAILHYPSTAHLTGQLKYEALHGDLIASTTGLYRVLVEYTEDVRLPQERDAVILRVMHKLHGQRALCEDFISIQPIEYEAFGVNAELKVIDGSDIDRIAGEVFSLIYDFFSPDIKFYSLDQMMKKGYSAEEIFEGPLLDNGFLDTAELNQSERYRNVHQSDIVNLLSGINELVAVRQCTFPCEYGTSYADFSKWIDDVRARGKMPQLDLSRSNITFVRTSDRHRTQTQNQVNAENVRAIYKFLQSDKKQSGLRQFAEDIPIPRGEDMKVDDYVPMLHDLPANYGLQERIVEQHKDAGKLDELAFSKFGRRLDELNPDQKRQVHKAYNVTYLENLKSSSRQALQLKGFLLVFEQIMADYLSQLAHLKALFSFNDDAVKTYFPQTLKHIHDLETLLLNISEQGEMVPVQMETEASFHRRRDQLLNHLLARFGENMDFYGNDLKTGDPINNNLKLAAKAAFLRDYVDVSKHRGAGLNYKIHADAQHAWNVAGLKKRICRLLGIGDYSNRYCTGEGINILQMHQVDGSESSRENVESNENFHVVEHLLLRPKVAGVTLLKTTGDVLSWQQQSESEDLIGYAFGVSTQPDLANGGTLWKLQLMDGSKEVLYTEDDFIFESHLNKRIENIRTFAAEPGNYELEQDTTGKYSFKIVNGNKVLAVSAIEYQDIEERAREIQQLMRFFSFELSLKPRGSEDFAGGSYAFPNPYAFQISIFIPNWAGRFRDPSFKHLLEKAIYLETPAHIYAHVYWLDYMQMKTFEQAYDPWLRTLAEDEIPDTAVVNNLVQVINDLNR